MGKTEDVGALERTNAGELERYDELRSEDYPLSVSWTLEATVSKRACIIFMILLYTLEESISSKGGRMLGAGVDTGAEEFEVAVGWWCDYLVQGSGMSGGA